jgi:hypothetical protein
LKKNGQSSVVAFLVWLVVNFRLTHKKKNSSLGNLNEFYGGVPTKVSCVESPGVNTIFASISELTILLTFRGERRICLSSPILFVLSPSSNSMPEKSVSPLWIEDNCMLAPSDDIIDCLGSSFSCFTQKTKIILKNFYCSLFPTKKSLQC